MSWGLWDGLCSFWHPRVLSALSAALAVAFLGLHLSPCPNDNLWGPSPPLPWFPQFSKVGRAQLCVSLVMLGSAQDLYKRAVPPAPGLAPAPASMLHGWSPRQQAAEPPLHLQFGQQLSTPFQPMFHDPSALTQSGASLTSARLSLSCDGWWLGSWFKSTGWGLAPVLASSPPWAGSRLTHSLFRLGWIKVLGPAVPP